MIDSRGTARISIRKEILVVAEWLREGEIFDRVGMLSDRCSVAAPELAPQCATPERDITMLLAEWSTGDQSALERLTPIVYDELLRLARIRLSGESLDRTLQATALVHEAYLKLMDHRRMSWQNRAHFFAIVATIMRRILIDDARKRNAEKRGRRLEITLQEDLDASDKKPADVLAVELALQSLAKIDERKSRVVELRYFGGLTTEEISEVIGVSVATVGRDLRVAHAWLLREMTGRR